MGPGQELRDEDKARDFKGVPAVDKFSGMATIITNFPEPEAPALDVDQGVYFWNLSWLAKVD